MRRILSTLFLSLVFCRFLVGCSQVVSNPYEDEFDESGMYYVEGDWTFAPCDSSAIFKASFFDSVKYSVLPEIEYGTLIDERDGRRYKTLQVGGQVWMAENLNYADERADNYLVGNNR